MFDDFLSLFHDADFSFIYHIWSCYLSCCCCTTGSNLDVKKLKHLQEDIGQGTPN